MSLTLVESTYLLALRDDKVTKKFIKKMKDLCN